MHIGFKAISVLGSHVAIAPIAWTMTADFLKTYYSDTQNIGDNFFPIKSAKDDNGNYFGNTGKYHTFYWNAYELIGFTDAYRVVTVKISLTNWSTDSGDIHLFSKFKVHDEWDKPSITIFTKKLNYSDCLSAK